MLCGRLSLDDLRLDKSLKRLHFLHLLYQSMICPCHLLGDEHDSMDKILTIPMRHPRKEKDRTSTLKERKMIIWVSEILRRTVCLRLTFLQPVQKPSSESSDSHSQLKI